MTEADLRDEIAHLPSHLRARLDAAGFDADRLCALAAPLHARARGEAPGPRDERNRVRGVVEPPRPGDIFDLPNGKSPEGARLATTGNAAVHGHQVALCVMAGGMATRMGGVVKALVPVLGDRTFLDLRLAENAASSAIAGAPPPLWLMTSEATDAPIRAALAERSAGANVATFTQDIGLRLTREGLLFRGEDGLPSTYATGHGDLPDALRRSGLLARFIEGGGKYVVIANLDNLGATIDPFLLGAFIEREAELMVEVTPKIAGDRGGIPVWADALDRQGRTTRRLQVLEEFRLPAGFDATAVRVFNTNTFIVRADALARSDVRWSWFEVEKNVGDRVAVQFERLLQELTAALPAAYARVPREGAESRFLPVKDYDELAVRRQDIDAVARVRGMLPAE
ncbi:MAG TPA: UTP--glucose-1-phosphate uridylyltransferase [Polyangiaceae bacterium]|jgi:UTP--glucose-1-phosphate uridylyltransferase